MEWNKSHQGTASLATTSNMSSTYLFHNLGLQSMGAVLMADCSRCSMKILATRGDTGLPIAAPNYWRRFYPGRLEGEIGGRWSPIIQPHHQSTTWNPMFYCSPWATFPFSSLSFTMSSTLLIGRQVNSETKSCEFNMLPSSFTTFNISSAKSLELGTWWTVVPTIGPNISASHLDVWYSIVEV